MSRRNNEGEQEFGSDSFLDIIANIVGILIILIVVAGVKVARQSEQPNIRLAREIAAVNVPDDVSTITETTAWPWSSVEDVVEDRAFGLTIPGFTAVEAEEVELTMTLAEAEETVSSLSLQLLSEQQLSAGSEEELRQLQTLLAQRTDEEALQSKRLASINEEQTRLVSAVLELQQDAIQVDGQTQQFQSTLASLSQRQEYVQDALTDVSRETLRLREVLETEDVRRPDSRRLNHRLSPVGRTVAKTEEQRHFRLSGGRIAHVPLLRLAKRAEEQILRRRNMISQVPKYEGQVGPIEGFMLRYTMLRELRSPGEMYANAQPYSFRTDNCDVMSTHSVRSESIDQALKLGSRFRQLLESTDPGTTVSIWLYPDDFKHFSRLREFAHGLDLRVAAWPRTDGQPISIGAGGSQSISQ